YPSVGITGGYSQAAGHSILSAQYGLGADQVLEWEVVMANGERVVATPTRNTDLHWAMSGGGPGTYGVVISMTIRAHKDGAVGGALLAFGPDGIFKATYWKAIAAFQTQLPAIVDAGATAIYIITQAGFQIAPLTAPGKSDAEVKLMLTPFTRALDQLNITYSLNVSSASTFMGHFTKYFNPFPYAARWKRLIPRSVVEQNNDALTPAFRDITVNSAFYVAVTALGVGKPKKATPVSDNAVLPAWRNALLTVLVPSVWDFTVPRSVMEERESQLTNSIIPKLTTLTPGLGTYMNGILITVSGWDQAKDEMDERTKADQDPRAGTSPDLQELNARGIGAGLVEVYLSRRNTTVVAGVRDPKHPTSQKLSSLPADSSSKVIVVKIDNKSESDPATAISTIQSQGITKLDLVIANAGICSDFAPLATVDPGVFKEHVVVNGFAPLFLFQAVLPLMLKAEGAKFVGIGSPMGSIGGMDMRPFPMTAYGSSKAIFHWIVRKVHFEHPELTSLVVDPGLVQTDMGNNGARLFGMEEAPVPTKASVDGIVARVRFHANWFLRILVLMAV
ncbi:MAG: hypothetical protein LQ337_002639, partial [Flavoplaca oasis]